MTAVIGILNKHGIAIAADSAVTRTRGRGSERTQKCTKNGNKMLRLSNTTPVSVMITGNADFLCNPWDVIIRRYRQQRGNLTHPTVEACLYDLFDYIAKCDELWDDRAVKRWIFEVAGRILDAAWDEMPADLAFKDFDGNFEKPKSFVRSFKSILKKKRKWYAADGVCPHFSGYTLEHFRNIAGEVLNDFIELHTGGDDKPFTTLPEDVFDELKDDFELTLMTRLTTRYEYNSANLIFSGYGSEEEYPTLISVNVCEGFDRKVNFIIRPDKDVVHISDDTPVAICPFAQTDVATSILQGMHRDVSRRLNLMKMFDPLASEVFDLDFNSDEDVELYNQLTEVRTDDLFNKITKPIDRFMEKKQKQWEHQLENYDLKAMAALAESLISLTGFQRILTFQQEGVGGPVDVAVITRADGFIWLSRKSWYHHKDINGQYGNMGV